MKWLAACLALTTAPLPMAAQDLFHQPTNASVPAPVPQGILDTISDPVFSIVIRADPQPRTPAAVINAMLEGGQSDFQSFVVGEQIGRPETSTPDCGSSLRRMVIAFTGSHAPSGTVLEGNVFLSLFLSPSGPGGDLEVLAWDQVNDAYNYYKLEQGTWRLRNRSSDLGTVSEADLSNGCLACHVNGAPVMKEFAFPWNHWHGLPNTFLASYLSPGQQSWPAAGSDFLGPRLTGAQNLESTIQSSVQRFVGKIVEDRIATAADGSVTVSGLPDLLDSLFETTELNLGSSNIKSGLDGGGLTQRATTPLNIPDSFFVNIAQMRDIDLPVFEGQGLVTEVFTPVGLGLSVTEYEALLTEFNISTECMPGRDTLFPWFGPEPSEFDRRMVERLNRRGILDDEFVASVLAVDVETPLFSQPRASLLSHIPESVTAPTRGQLPDALRTAVIESLQNTAPRSEPEEDFLSLLLSADPVGELDTRVQQLLDRTNTLLSDPVERAPHLRMLYARLIANRDAFRESEISIHLNEFPGLLPSE